MKKIAISMISLLMIFATAELQAQITIPAPSPAGKVSSKIGLTDVEITYSRPKVKGRKIFGEGEDFLQPYGQLWRAGANAGTIMTISTDIMINGKTLPEGEYMILATPGANQWTVIFYGDKSIGGNMSAFKEEDAVIKVDIKPTKLTEPVEALTFNISDIAADNTGAAIELAWANTSVKVPFTVNFDEIVMKQIEANTKVNPQNYVAAANYYFNSGKDSKKALEWITMYFAADPSYESQFWNLHLMAQIQKATGDTKGAKATAEKSIEIAKNNDGGDFGYIKRNEDLIASLK